MSSSVAPAPQPALSPDEARSLTDEVKRDAERLWRKLGKLYEGGAHKALGYSSWGAYFQAEFGGSERHAYELLNAGLVMETLESSAQLRTRPANEAQARELAPLLGQPEILCEAWAKVEEKHPEPTAADVRRVVAEVVHANAPASERERVRANAHYNRLVSALSHIHGNCIGLKEIDLSLALAACPPAEVADWLRRLGEAAKTLKATQHALREASSAQQAQ